MGSVDDSGGAASSIEPDADSIVGIVSSGKSVLMIDRDWICSVVKRNVDKSGGSRVP